MAKTMPTKKRCTKCQKRKALTAFNRCSAARDGCYAYCRPCAKAYSQTYFADETKRKRHNARMVEYYKNPANSARKRAYMDAWLKDPTNRRLWRQYWKNYSRRPEVKARRAAWRSRPETKKHFANWIAANRHRINAYSAAYYARPKNKRRRQLLFQTPRYRALFAKANHRRRVAKRKGRQQCTAAERELLLNREREKFRIITELGLDCVTDHIIPISRGGLDTPANTQILTRRDNAAKFNKLNYPVTPLTYDDLIANPTLLKHLLSLQERNLPTFGRDADGKPSRRQVDRGPRKRPR